MHKRLFLSEDWLATLLGLTAILLYLAGLNASAPLYGWSNIDDLFAKVVTVSNMMRILVQLVFVVSISFLAAYVSRKNISTSVTVTVALFIVAQLAMLVSGNAAIKSYNLEPVIFSLLFGLLLNQSVNLPEHWRGALSSEWYIKVGLVLLGTTVIFSDLLKAGSLGLIQSIVVVLSVWYVSYWICRRLKLDSELTFMLSSAVSICGVSAAIATAGAIKGDPKKLSFVISLVLLVAIPMMVGMPYLARYLSLSQEVTGAWLGGTIDTTGAVAAAGTLAGETALKVSTIVKFSQNVLLGLAAFAISIYWTYSNHSEANNKPSFITIWDRFPKFVIGFLVASLIFSFFLAPSTIVSVKDNIKSLQTLLFVIGFSAIGLETKFSHIFSTENRKPFYAFLSAQAFNILITLGLALLLFK